MDSGSAEIGLVLSGAGGGIGFLGGALWNDTRDYSKITGVSSGAIVAAMKATDQMSLLRTILFNITDEEVAKKRTFRYGKRFLTHLIGIQKPLLGVYDNSPLRSLLREHLLHKTVKIPFTVIAYCLDTGEAVYFTITGTITEQDIQKIIASTAIPGVFSPESINGKWYVDGGVATHTPIQPLKRLLPNASHITIISTAGQSRGKFGGVKSDVDVLSTVIGDMVPMVAELDFLKFEYRNRLAAHGIDYTYYPSTVIRPSQRLAPTTRFHHEFMKKDWEHGLLLQAK